MSTLALTRGLSKSVGEREPLLKTSTPNASARGSDLEAAMGTEPEGHKGVRKVLWYMFLIIGALMTVMNNKEGMGSDNMSPGYTSSHTLPQFDYNWAWWRALGSGLSGAAAMAIQALMLMPLRTTLNYQHVHDITTTKAIKTLYGNGSYSRYYRGLAIALIYRSLARFGDTAANDGVLALLGSNMSTKELPSPIKTVFASLCATAFRIILTPVETVASTIQIEGLKPGLKSLRRRIKDRGITSLWSGALTGAPVSFVEHYFWFATYNYLSEVLPKQHSQKSVLSWRAFIGFCAALISYAMLFPVVALRMMYLLSHGGATRSIEDARNINVADGPLVLFGRGWQVKIIERGLQGVVFAVFWKMFLDIWDKNTMS